MRLELLEQDLVKKYMDKKRELEDQLSSTEDEEE